MPDRDGKLSDAEVTLVVDQLNEMAASDQCPVCGEQNPWVIEQHVTARIRFGGSLQLFGGTVYPEVTVSCKKCAHFRSFSAIRLGIEFDPSKDEAPEEGSEETHAEGASGG